MAVSNRWAWISAWTVAAAWGCGETTVPPEENAPAPPLGSSPAEPSTPRCYSIVFQEDFSGRLSGDREQCVFSDQSSSPVEAVPRSGFRFVAWSDGSIENPRVLESPDEDLILQPEFATEGLTTVWLGHSFIRWNAELLYDIAKNDAGYGDHSDWMTFSGGANGAPGSLWDADNKREQGQEQIRMQSPDNVVMTYHPLEGSSDYEDYENWVDYTLLYAPNARFYISLPWRNTPLGNGPLPPLISEDGAEDLEGPYVSEFYPSFKSLVLDRLRENYPSSEFIIIPQVIAADRVIDAHFDGTLTVGENAEALHILNPKQLAPFEHEQSIYDDRRGHPGGPLRLLTVMLYLRYVYGAEVSSLDFWDSKESFSNLGLEGIAPKQSFTAPYRFYRDFDFPVVADDIFRSYGSGE